MQTSAFFKNSESCDRDRLSGLAHQAVDLAPPAGLKDPPTARTWDGGIALAGSRNLLQQLRRCFQSFQLHFRSVGCIQRELGSGSRIRPPTRRYQHVNAEA